MSKKLPRRFQVHAVREKVYFFSVENLVAVKSSPHGPHGKISRPAAYKIAVQQIKEWAEQGRLTLSCEVEEI